MLKKKSFYIKPTLEVGKTYRVKVNGKEAILRYDSGVGTLNHCKTCTCTYDQPQYTLVSGDIGAGRYNDLELLEEVK